jgi:hypothetical protein
LFLYFCPKKSRAFKKKCFAKDIIQTMRRWFVYGLYALYQYWLSCYYSLRVFIIHVTQWIKTHHEAKGLAIYLWLWVMSYRLRLSSRSEMTLSLYDSG